MFFNAKFILLFFFAVVVIFRRSLTAVPRLDQSLSFVHDRLWYDSDIATFFYSLSHNRTRWFNQGDIFLFRPGTTGFAAISDIVSNGNFYWFGLLTLFWHAMACWLIFHCARKYLSTFGSVLVALVFATQFAGLKMVAWRHISPYILGLVFFALALNCLRHSIESSRKSLAVWSGAFFLISMMFHETASVAVPIAGILVWIFSKEYLVVRNVAVSSAAIFWVINGVDYLSHSPYSSALSAAKHTLPNLGILLGLGLEYLGKSVVAFVFPTLGQINVSDNTAALFWRPPAWPSGLFSLIGLITSAGFIAVGARAAWTLRRKTDWVAVASLFILTYLAVLTFGVVAGRLALRENTYFEHSTYYFYFYDFLFWLLLLPLYGRWAVAQKASQKRALQITAAILLPVYVYYRGHRISQALAPSHITDSTIARTVGDIAGRMARHPSWCYGGALKLPLNRLAAPLFIYRKSCYLHSGTPVYLFSVSNSEREFVFLDGFGASEKRAKVVGPANFARQADLGLSDLRMVHAFSGGEKLGGARVIASGIAKAAVIFNTRNRDGGLVLFMNFPYLYAYQFNGEKIDPLFFSDGLPIIQTKSTSKLLSLEIRQVGKEWVVFLNRIAVAQTEGLGELEGQGYLLSGDGPTSLEVMLSPEAAPLRTLPATE